MPAMMRTLSSLAVRLLVGGLLILPAFAQLTSTPSSLSFSNTYIGLNTASKSISVKNTGTSSVTINSITSSCPEFKLASGTTPVTLAKSATTSYSFYFAPQAAQLYSCNYTLVPSSGSNLVVAVSGTGLSTKAVVGLSTTSLTFANQSVGTPSATQSVKISNTGTAGINVTGIAITPPTFSITPVTLPIVIKGNSSATINVSYSPAQAISEAGVLGLVYNDIPEQVVDLTGNGVAAASLVIANVATLPAATVEAAYQAQLIANSGTSPYTFSLQSGSTLPSGLTISSAGLISGTLASTVTVGTYTFTAQVNDSKSHSATKLLSLTVSKATGADCNNISFDVSGTTTPITPLTDLGTGSYGGEEGGLYSGGTNTRPTSQTTYGQTLAGEVQPLSSSGAPDPTGKIVFLALGESTALDEFGVAFLPLAQHDPAINSNIVFVDGAQGGATPGTLLTTTGNKYFNTIINNYLPDQGVTANQVQVMWIEDSNGIATGTFPTDMTTLTTDYETVLTNLHTLFPHLLMVYFSSRIYAGYSNGVAKINPEPYAYESGFAVKNAIEDQYDGSGICAGNGCSPIVAPWVSWGPYYWANGLLPSENGMVWTCQDLQADGTHPQSPSGDLKVATQVLNFFKTDVTTTPWFLKP
jgi:putative Ig domain-containing protein